MYYNRIGSKSLQKGLSFYVFLTVFDYGVQAANAEGEPPVAAILNFEY